VDTKAEFGVEWVLCHRVDVQAELHRLATRPDGPGEPAKILLNSRVVACDPEQGSVTLKDGTVMTADVIIGTSPYLPLHDVTNSSPQAPMESAPPSVPP
jgi:salicylate hydroxylase